VNIYLLIISQISNLSTILISGANLISLYLFSSKIGGKVMEKAQIYAFYKHVGWWIMKNL